MRTGYALNVTFVIEKLEIGQFSLYLDNPLDPRCPFDNEMSLDIYPTHVKGVMGLRENRVVQPKEDTRHLTNENRFAKWSFLLQIN